MRVGVDRPAPLRSLSAGLAGWGRARDGCLGPLYSVDLVALVVDVGVVFVVLSFVASGGLPGLPMPVLLPSTGWPVSMPSGELLRWKFGGGGMVSEGRFFNNGSSYLHWIFSCGAMSSSLAGRGGEGIGWSGAASVRSGVGAGVLLRECSSHSRRCVRLRLRFLELRRSKPGTLRDAGSPSLSLNKLVLCRSSRWGSGCFSLHSSR